MMFSLDVSRHSHMHDNSDDSSQEQEDNSVMSSINTELDSSMITDKL